MLIFWFVDFFFFFDIELLFHSNKIVFASSITCWP